MTNNKDRLQTALRNSPERVYKSTREYEAFVAKQTERLKEAVDQEITTGLPKLAKAALVATEQSKAAAEQAASQAQEHLDTTADRLEEAKKLLNIATDVAWGGTHDASARADHETANRLRFAAFVLYGMAVAVAAWFVWWTSGNPPEGWEWLARPLIGGPVAILLWAAAYASRESREHRNSARLFKHQSLAFNSLDQYADRIGKANQREGTSEAASFLKDTAKSLFTNQIDAHIDQIKTQGRTGRFARKLGQERSSRG